jgi:hypothetical protein
VLSVDADAITFNTDLNGCTLTVYAIACTGGNQNSCLKFYWTDDSGKEVLFKTLQCNDFNPPGIFWAKPPEWATGIKGVEYENCGSTIFDSVQA